LDRKWPFLSYTFASLPDQHLGLLLFHLGPCDIAGVPGETEVGSAGAQPDQGITRSRVYRRYHVGGGPQPRWWMGALCFSSSVTFAMPWKTHRHAERDRRPCGCDLTAIDAGRRLVVQRL
jgi:hypothetical protein